MPQASENFAYNPRNQLGTISRPNGVSTAYTYDSIGRLLGLNHSKGSVAIETESYAYDGIGNRTSHATSVGQALSTPPTTNLFDAANRLVQFGSIPETYDANGNLIQDGTATYTWDSRNRLKTIVTTAGQTTSFTYDFAGNLIVQADSGASLNLTKYFMLDDLTNVTFAGASDGTSYSVLSGRWIDSHFATVQATGQVQYGLADAINSTVATVDQVGAVQSQIFYNTFGQTTMAGTYPFQYTGRVPISNSLYYYRARYYNATTGRFISEDPIGFIAGPNLYSYSRNNPAGFTDPRGTSVTMAGARLVGAVLYAFAYGRALSVAGAVGTVEEIVSGLAPFSGTVAGPIASTITLLQIACSPDAPDGGAGCSAALSNLMQTTGVQQVLDWSQQIAQWPIFTEERQPLSCPYTP
jgi:RHS repeat-associated protein